MAPLNGLSVVDRGPFVPCPASFNLAAHVLGKAKQYPNKIALAVLSMSGADRWSYARLSDTVFRLASALRSRGLTSGDKVLMRLGNTVEFPLVYLASIAADLVPVPTSAQLTAPEITKMAAGLQPGLIVASDGVALPAPCPSPVISTDDLEALATSHPPLDPVLGDPNRPGYIVFTSGTSGQPRAVVHAHRAIWARQMMVEGWYGLHASDRLLHAGAFNWTYTLGTGLLDPWTIGATALIPAPGTDAQALPLLLKRHDATIFAAAPGVYRQVLKCNLPAMPKLRHGLSAGEKLPEPIRLRWREVTGTDMHEAFGMSECSTFLSGNPDDPAPASSLGRPQIGRKIALIGEDHAPVPLGSPGVIAIGRDDPGLMLEYLNAPDETKSRYTPDSAWFLTGDMGQMDETGAVTYLGRNDDMMNAGGFRVSPLEVEAALLAHPGIDETAASEITVKADTTVIALFYTGPEEVKADELSAFAETRLARYKAPRVFVHCATLPRNPNGKLQRKKLRQQYEEAHGPT